MPALRTLRDAAIFAPCYVALDWASYFDPLGPFNITPWNPQAALAIVWMFLGGLQHAPAVFGTIVLADALVRDAPGGWLITALTSICLTGGYAEIAWLLRSFLADRGLRTSRSLTVLVAVVVGGTAIIGAAFVGVLSGAGLLGQTPGLDAWLRFWVGDAVGVLVTAPLLLVAADAERRRALLALARRRETLAQVAALLATLWLVFNGPGRPETHFYFLFVPLIWIAARAGINGAIVAIAIVQLGVVAGVHGGGNLELPVLELQALVAALTLTGLYLGMMVDERERATQSLNHTLRLAAAGEMAGAIAHEVNQPLTALANYGQSARMLSEGADPRLPGVLDSMLREANRASEVVRRLRDFFRSGTTRLETVPPEELLGAIRRIGTQVVGSSPVAFDVEGAPDLPAILVDRLQIELVLRNLFANALEALRGKAGRIRVAARRQDSGDLAVVVSDSGPGITAEMRERVFEPFVSGKESGMGLGLAISRAIAEAHGGSLEVHPGEHGEFQLVLPCRR